MKRCKECGRVLDYALGARRGLCDTDYRRHLHQRDRSWAVGAIEKRFRERRRLERALQAYWPVWQEAHAR